MLGWKRNRHRRCVEVAAITCYQSSRRQQRVPGVVTFTYRDNDPGGVLRTSSDGDDRRIFLGLKFSIPGFFWV